jgi:hypothetical protein
MNQDKLSQYLREFLFESKGRNALIYEEASKLVRMLKRDYANQEIRYTHFLGFGDNYSDNDEISLLRPYLPFRFNIQGHSKYRYNFYIHKFDNDGNIIEIFYKFGEKAHEIIKLKKPLDLFGHFLNKKTEDSYLTISDYAIHWNFSFVSKETKNFAVYFEDLIRRTKNTGDDLVRDDELYKQEINNPYKYCWEEDYLDDETNEVKTIRRCEYSFPGNKQYRTRTLNK